MEVKRKALIIGASLLFASACGKEPKSGETCDPEGDQKCNAERVVYTCKDGKWATDGSTADEYTCDCHDKDWNGCGVPGFVGIERSLT